MDPALLDTLKDKLVNADNLKEIMGFFLDHVAEDPEFVSAGEFTRHPKLEAVIREVVKGTAEEEPAITNLVLIRVPGRQFIHGGCLVDGKLANVLYFEDIHVGLLAVVASLSSGQMEFSRFSDLMVRRTDDPSLN